MSSRLFTVALSASIALVPAVGGVSATALAAPAAAVGNAKATTTTSVTTVTGASKPTIARTATNAPTAKPKALANPPMLRVGSTGPMVTTLQNRLGGLGYWVGPANGRFDHATSQAVMAVQKVAGLTRDGVAGPATWRALDKAVTPKARSTTGRVAEIDLKRQVLLLVENGKVRYVINTSTGAKATPTPKGTFRVFRQIDRWHTAPLGKLYRPKYFYRGYAVHGVADGGIPAAPASHGCARVSTKAMDLLWGKSGLRVGDRVLVY